MWLGVAMQISAMGRVECYPLDMKPGFHWAGWWGRQWRRGAQAATSYLSARQYPALKSPGSELSAPARKASTHKILLTANSNKL